MNSSQKQSQRKRSDWLFFFALTTGFGLTVAAQAQPAREAGREELSKQDQFEVVPQIDLRGTIIREMIVAEGRARNGETQEAAREFLSLAKRTGDSRFARRATEILLQARRFEQAFEASQLWISMAPQSINAQRVFDGLGIAKDRFNELEPVLLQRLKAAKNPKQRSDVWNSFLGTIVQTPKRAPAESFFDRFIQRPGATLDEVTDARVAKAKFLIGQRDLPAATVLANQASTANPTHVGALFLTLQLAVQAKQLAAAQAGAEQLAQLNSAEAKALRGETQILLAALHEALGQIPQATARLRSVDTNDLAYLRSQLGLSRLQLHSEGSTAALRTLEQLEKWTTSTQRPEPISEVEREQIARTKATALREARQYQEALRVLSAALAVNQQSAELRYEYALAAERAGQFERMEETLIGLIREQPNNPMFLNALGYSWADRKVRLEEAEQLIRNALAIDPKSGMIIDSLGWVLYRQGKNQEAIAQLRLALAAMPDGEIAAHLAEVLWVTGQREEATALLKEWLARKPLHPVVEETVRRLGVPLTIPAR